VLVWLGMHEAGIHPTLAGVVIGLMTPVRTWLGDDDLPRVTGEAVSELHHRRAHGSEFAARSPRSAGAGGSGPATDGRVDTNLVF